MQDRPTQDRTPALKTPSLWQRLGESASLAVRNALSTPEQRIAPIRLKARFNHMASGLVPAAHPAHPDIKDCLTPRDAVRLFDYFNDLSYIAFNYSENGCFARAHLMCREIEDLSEGRITPLKIWADGDRPFGRLSPVMPNGYPAEIEWGYHVTAGAYVLDAQGRIFPAVFDPSLFDGPVTVDEWRDAMNALPEQIALTPFGGDSPKGSHTGYHYFADAKPPRNPDASALSMMERYLRRAPQGDLPKLPSKFRRAQLP